MRHAVAVAAAEHAEVIDARGDVRQQIGDFDAGLAVLVELVLRGEELVLIHPAACFHSAERFRQFLAVQALQFRFRIECF